MKILQSFIHDNIVDDSTLSLYQYVPYKAKKNVYKTKTIKKQKDTGRVDLSRLVVLGGEFKKIGDEDEVIGGGNQKVGTANQQ